MDDSLSREEIDSYVHSIDDFFNLKVTNQIDYFVHFLTTVKNKSGVQGSDIKQCFILSDITPYSNIPSYLSVNSKKKPKQHPKFIKSKEGYKLHRTTQIALEGTISKAPLKAKANKELNDLLTHLSDVNENEFLREAISCFEISAYRASIIMVWNLTLDHLFNYILKHKSSEFNAVLATNTDKRIKITTVTTRDDFSEIPENKFIEFSRSAKIISNDVRKILETKLGIRNTYAHPSSLKVSESRAVEFIEDLVTNVILKFSI